MAVRYNILIHIVYDEKTYSTVEADCNLYVPNNATSALMVIVGSDGGERRLVWHPGSDPHQNPARPTIERAAVLEVEGRHALPEVCGSVID